MYTRHPVNIRSLEMIHFDCKCDVVLEFTCDSHHTKSLTRSSKFNCIKLYNTTLNTKCVVIRNDIEGCIDNYYKNVMYRILELSTSSDKNVIVAILDYIINNEKNLLSKIIKERVNIFFVDNNYSIILAIVYYPRNIESNINKLINDCANNNCHKYRNCFIMDIKLVDVHISEYFDDYDCNFFITLSDDVIDTFKKN